MISSSFPSLLINLKREDLAKRIKGVIKRSLHSLLIKIKGGMLCLRMKMVHGTLTMGL